MILDAPTMVEGDIDSSVTEWLAGCLVHPLNHTKSTTMATNGVSIERNIKYLIFFAIQAIFVSPAAFAGDIARKHEFTGKVTETKDRLVMEGGTLIGRNTDTSPLLELSKDGKKELILSNVTIVSNNQRFVNPKGTAAIIDMDNARSDSRVTLRNVRILARNPDVQASGVKQDVCAALFCGTLGRYDSYRSINVMTSGRARIDASQGARPDLRKFPAQR